MKKTESMINDYREHVRGSNLSEPWRRMLACIALFAVAFLAPQAQAQTTIKPFQIRIEVPTGYAGTIILSNNVMRVATNGATGTDITGTNWVIPNVSVNITGAPGGVTATPVDSSLNLVTTVPINMNTNNASTSTNLFVKLVFDGTQASGSSTLSFNATGGVTNDFVLLTLEVGKIWNGAANAVANGAGNWSDSSKWLGGSAPGPNDNVVFTDVGTQTNVLNGVAGVSTNLLVNSTVDVSTVISSLRFGQTNGLGTPATNYHNLLISPGVTLAIKGNDGFSMLRDYTYVANTMNVTISGTNGTLIQTNENANFTSLIDGQQRSYLDMSRLDNLHLNVRQMPLGDIFAYPNYNNLITNGYASGSTLGGSRPQKAQPTWTMAKTNYVRAVYVDPYNYNNASSRNYALVLGRNELTGGSSGNFYNIIMGYTNSFNMDGICIAGYGALGSTVSFLNTNSFALFRNTNGGRMTIFACADAAGTASQNAGANTKCGNSGFGVDFTKGTVDMMVDRFYMSMDRSNATGAGVIQASFGMGKGIVDANNAFIGYQASGNQTNQNDCVATLTVTNTAVFKVNDTLALGYTTATAGDPSLPGSTYGKVVIGPGGTVMASNITVGGTSKASGASTGNPNSITLTAGASLIVSNGIADATPNGALGALSFGGNCSLTLFIDGSKPSIPLVYVTNLSSTLTGNKLIIGGVKNLVYPADVPLIAGAGPAIATAVFDAGVSLPAGLGLSGTLSLSSSNTINIHIINRAPNYLVWRGTNVTGTADWDYATKNWRDQVTGLMTNYENPDYIAFDDTVGVATNINIAGGSAVLTPSAINVTNNTLQYTFLDGGNQVAGGPALNKYGTGTVEIDGNTTVAVHLNQGLLTGFSPGSVGGVTVSAGAVMNYFGAIGGSLNCAGTATSHGSIAGSMTVLPGGVVTNSGTLANQFAVQTNGFLYNSASGALNSIGAGSSGSPQIANGALFINDGVVGLAGNGDILYVNGTFEDLGGGSDTMTLQSVTVGVTGTFIPGGDGIGTTVIHNDGSTTFDGAALLVQGSKSIFKVNPSPTANTLMTAAHLSFGGSSGNQTQNGSTLVITNISATPFSAGQTFQLFNNIYSSAIAPYSTGSSTNTFPVISPATPGPGLAWDLSHLWVPNGSGNSGVIGIVSSSSGPSLTNSFALDGNGSNIVAQFSWDASNYGWRLQTLVTPITAGLTATNWTGVTGSWTNTTMTITNVLGTNCVFYRLAFP